MNKFSSRLAVSMIVMSCSLSGWAANPCMPIAQACMNAGFYKGGETVGKGLVKQCVLPTVMGQTVVPNATFSDTVLQQCKMVLMQKMNAR